MFKKLIAAAATLVCLTGPQVEAAPTTCAYRTSNDFIEFDCDHNIRVNANGHKVNEVIFFDGNKRYEWAIIFWEGDNGQPSYAEAWYNGERVVTDAYIAKNGSWCLNNNNSQFCFF